MPRRADRAQFAQRSANGEESVTRIPTHENLLTSVPTQNVDSAELTDIKRILNVLLKKKEMVCGIDYMMCEAYEDGSRIS